MISESHHYDHSFSHDQIVECLKEISKSGISKDLAVDYLYPPNLMVFYLNLPKPERDRLLNLGYQ